MDREPTCTVRDLYGTSSYGIVDGELAWVKRKTKFDVKFGDKFQVQYNDPMRTLHKNAVGVYIGSCETDGRLFAILKCSRRKFKVEATALMPWTGEITREHLKFISPNKKFHLKRGDGSACKCDCTKFPNPKARLLCIEDFSVIPENSRCKNCGNIFKRESNQQG